MGNLKLFEMQELIVAAKTLANKNASGDAGIRRSREICPLCQLTGYAESPHSDLRECRLCPNMAFAVYDKFDILYGVPCNQRPERYNTEINAKFWSAIVIYLKVNSVLQFDYFNSHGVVRKSMLNKIKSIHKQICDGEI